LSSHNRNRPFHGAALVALVAGLAGCTPGGLRNGSNDPLLAPAGSISVYQLAGHLGLSLENSSSTAATLRNNANVVMIFGRPAGQAYVNGTPVGASGGIVPSDGMLFIPQPLESDIRQALRIPRRVRAVPAPRPSPRAQRLGQVVIDAGHGGQDPGAISILGVREKTIVLDTALRIAGELERAGVEATLTRGHDTSLTLEDRAALANRIRPRLFVSVHADSAENGDAQGFTVYVAREASSESLAAAQAVERRLAGLGIRSRGIRRANYRVLVQTTCPAVLVELGYLSSIDEATKLVQSAYRRRLAVAIAQGIADHLRLQ